jgi:hypothetical protein
MDASGRTACLPGTRVATIQFIIDWAKDPTGIQNVLWLHGVAGAGKSTVATTMANRFRKMGQLGAFLFFNRDVTERSDPFTVIRTLAHQLGSFHDSAGDAILAAINECPSVCLSPLHDQFQQLLVDPLSADGVINPGAPIVFVLDAFDECGSPKEREILLDILVNKSVRLPPAIRILITSRMDVDISDAIQSQLQSHIISYGLEITSKVNGEDISSYLRYRLELILRKKRHLSLQSDWPGEQKIQRLVKRASGLFIWAATAMEFIDGYNPSGRLDAILMEQTNSGAQAALDSLYKTALECSGVVWDDREFVSDFTAVIGVVLVARRPLSTTAIDQLLRLQDGIPSRHTVSYLGCVLQQPVLRVLHPSFADFLLSRSRCGRDVWFFDPSIHNRQLAIRCLEHLTEVLKENMWDLRLSDDIVKESLAEDISYACEFWIDHICTIEKDTEPTMAHLDAFLFKHLLHWFEAMSILKRSKDTISMLDRLLRWILVSHIVASY